MADMDLKSLRISCFSLASSLGDAVHKRKSVASSAWKKSSALRDGGCNRNAFRNAMAKYDL